MNILIMIYYRSVGINGYYMGGILGMCIFLLSVYNYILLKGVIWGEIVTNLLLDCMEIKWGLMVEKGNLGMIWLISIVCSVILVYVRYYLSVSNNLIGVYLTFFSLFMIIFIISTLVIYGMIGYEFMGIISYILINFYIVKLQSNKCSLYCLLLGKMGDIGVLLCLFTLFFENDGISNLCAVMPCILVDTLVFLLIGVISKSAQYILLSWLTLAMLGPTRVSALLLSSTLVTSGLY